jgi:flagellar biosynthesis protein FlhG
MDQAQSLRDYMNRFQEQQENSERCRVITITSGKGGVGKSNFTLNFALSLKASGKKVVILDLDFATTNINILMGVAPRYNLTDVLNQKRSIWDVLETGVGGIEYIDGDLGIQDLIDFDQHTLSYFWDQIQKLQTYADFILLDTGAGISKELVGFIMASDETILITTPEPTSIADSYSVLKMMTQYKVQQPKYSLVVNRAQNFAEAVETSQALRNACNRFLNINLSTLGYIMQDTHVRQSVRAQTPFYLAFPKCEATKNINEIVHKYLPELNLNPTVSTMGIRGFFEKIISKGKSL